VRELLAQSRELIETDASRLNRRLHGAWASAVEFCQSRKGRTNENAPDSVESLGRSLNSPPPKSAHN
jgi:hypothetical protein